MHRSATLLPMATIQIRDLPGEVVEAFRARATEEGKSLQQFMRDFLIAAAPAGPNRDLFDEIDASLRLSRNTVSLDDIVAELREQRDAS
jgi:plasmid stability protein